jgi:hypothetical protein
MNDREVRPPVCAFHIRNWAVEFLHRMSDLSARKRKPVAEVVVRQDDANHGPYFGTIPRGTVFVHGERCEHDRLKIRAVLTIYPADREAVENRVRDPRSRLEFSTIENAPGRNIDNVTDGPRCRR